MLTHFASDKIPPWITVVIIAVLNLTFAISIAMQIERLKKLFVMHCIVRTHWLGEHRELSHKLFGNQVSRQVLYIRDEYAAWSGF